MSSTFWYTVRRMGGTHEVRIFLNNSLNCESEVQYHSQYTRLDSGPPVQNRWAMFGMMPRMKPAGSSMMSTMRGMTAICLTVRSVFPISRVAQYRLSGPGHRHGRNLVPSTGNSVLWVATAAAACDRKSRIREPEGSPLLAAWRASLISCVAASTRASSWGTSSRRGPQRPQSPSRRIVGLPVALVRALAFSSRWERRFHFNRARVTGRKSRITTVSWNSGNRLANASEHGSPLSASNTRGSSSTTSKAKAAGSGKSSRLPRLRERMCWLLVVTLGVGGCLAEPRPDPLPDSRLAVAAREVPGRGVMKSSPKLPPFIAKGTSITNTA
mmetsp:Transcript_13005/g.36888  ORF Transcript_13005/g.36888 Transcript_13005/m.36888 type:complete len:327 (+) Transcript_13005:1016-1996(+)